MGYGLLLITAFIPQHFLRVDTMCAAEANGPPQVHSDRGHRYRCAFRISLHWFGNHVSSDVFVFAALPNRGSLGCSYSYS